MKPRPAPPEKRDAGRMSRMFETVAPRYDFITRAFSYGMDCGWKRAAIERAALPEEATVLDLACGTGDFARLVRERHPQARVVGLDLTQRMLGLARRRAPLQPVCADAMRLPFADAVFDAVLVGYGLRNFPDLEAAIAEIRRVTRPGGQLVSLDFYLPRISAVRWLYLAWLWVQGAFWGLLLHGSPRVYTYIPRSLRGFVTAEEFSELLGQSGYERVAARPVLGGGIALHWATRCTAPTAASARR